MWWYWLVAAATSTSAIPCSFVDFTSAWRTGFKAVVKIEVEETVDHWDVVIEFTESVLKLEAWKGPVTKGSDKNYNISNTCYNNMVYSCQCLEIPFLVRHEPHWEGNITVIFNGQPTPTCSSDPCPQSSSGQLGNRRPGNRRGGPTKPPATYMPNIDYFLRGYNILRGNPHQVSKSSVDPGFQGKIFTLRYEQGSVTPDDRYFQPDGTLITMCQSCSLQAVTNKISGMKSYRDSLSEEVRVSAQECWLQWLTNRFSWSDDYKKVESEVSHSLNLYTHSDASCCAYQIQTNTYKPPPFSGDFLQGVVALPEEYNKSENKEAYRIFIDAFGTHYIKQTDMGSLFGQQSKISKQSWKKMLEKDINIEQSSSWSAIFASGSSDKLSDNHKEDVEKFNNFTSSQLLYTKGSKPPKDGSMAAWVKEAKHYPAPISFELGSILDLLANLGVSKATYENMKTALWNYWDNSFMATASWHNWLTNFTTGQRSDPKTCDNDGYVTRIQLARDTTWTWGDGLYDLCFKCSTENTPQCFNGTAPPSGTYWGMNMTCPNNGFKSMTTYETGGNQNHPINVKAQCYDDNEAQYAFHVDSSGTWVPWAACDPGRKIVGFQVATNFWGSNPAYKGRIMNFRFECT